MRYWIWWNDLIQGPFEPDELASLRGFSEDLMVCAENREDWIPAGRVADLSASLEQMKILRATPVAPPPPPPTRPPAVRPLQGEFFAEAPGQQTLLPSDDEPKGPYAYRPAYDQPGVPEPYFEGQVTNPFHFGQQPNHTSAVTLARTATQRIHFSPAQAIVKESPVRKEAFPESVPLQILHEETIEKSAVFSQAAESPSLAPRLEEAAESSRPEWLPWMMGVALAIMCLGSMGYWLMDRASTHSAITEANRLEPPVPMSLPATTPLPAPKVDVRDRTIPVAVRPASVSSKNKPLMLLARKKVRAAVAALKRTVAADASALSSRLQQATFHTMALFKSAASATGGAAGSPAAPAGLPAAQSAAGLGSTGFGTTASPSSWLQKIMSSAAIIKNAASIAGGAAVQPAVQSGLPVGQAGLPAGQAGAPASQAGAGVSAAVHTATSLGASRPGLASRTAAPAATAVRKKPAPRRAAHPASHRTLKPAPHAVKKRMASPAAAMRDESAQPSKIKPAAAREKPAQESEVKPETARDESAQTSKVKSAVATKLAAVRLPGLAVPLPVAPVSPSAAVSPEVPPVDVAVPAVPRSADPWAGRQSEAINLVMAKTLPGSKITVGVQAKTMLKQMHEKELMHAAETGERLYLPDKMAWAALQEDGARYRVYLNFQAMQANGERLQTRSYQFIVDLKSKTIRADDPATEQDLLTRNAELNFKHNPMATDIDSILGGVDTYNKHKLQMIIIKKSRSNRDERSKIEEALKTAQARLQRAIVYFRRTYPDKALQNVSSAYNFVELVNGK